MIVHLPAPPISSVKTISPLIRRDPNCSSGRRRAGDRMCSYAAQFGMRAVAITALLLYLALIKVERVVAQAPGQQYIQAGAGIVPGIGIQGGYVAPRSFFTVEGIVYVNGSPPFAGGQGSVQVSGGLGGAIRVLGIFRTIGGPGYQGRDFDVGLRFGPGLFFTLGESSRSENPFSLFLEPFLRATSTLGGERLFFAELGIHPPILRAGIWFAL